MVEADAPAASVRMPDHSFDVAVCRNRAAHGICSPHWLTRVNDQAARIPDNARAFGGPAFVCDASRVAVRS